ncbi:MAG: peptidylprolyl isomerase [Lutibacter sp.]|nr:MAG: peptidylprolyl isomerase [Lutibacter sp.]
MKIKNSILVFLMTTLLISCSQKTIQCEIETTEGKIIVELYPEKAPKTVANFLRYVDTNFYENTSFFRTCTSENEKDRTIKIQVIQGGSIDEKNDFPPIELETTEQTGVKHLNGVLSMARDKPNSATQNFFICIENQPELDYNGKRNPDGQGFAAFGKVIQGMDVVLKIQVQKNTNQLLNSPIRIHSIKRKG